MIKSSGSSSYATTILGVRESGLYRLKHKPMTEMASTRVTKNRNQKILRLRRLEGVNPQVQRGRSNFPRKSHGTRWPYVMLKSKSLLQGLTKNVRIASMSEGESKVEDLRSKT